MPRCRRLARAIPGLVGASAQLYPQTDVFIDLANRAARLIAQRAGTDIGRLRADVERLLSALINILFISLIGVIFVMGVVYAWLRIKSNSTTSPFLAHSAYNAIIFVAAALIA